VTRACGTLDVRHLKGNSESRAQVETLVANAKLVLGRLKSVI